MSASSTTTTAVYRIPTESGNKVRVSCTATQITKIMGHLETGAKFKDGSHVGEFIQGIGRASVERDEPCAVA